MMTSLGWREFFLAGVITGMCMAALAGLAGRVAHGRPLADFHNPPHVVEWFKSARNKLGQSCCDDADGIREGVAYPWSGGDRVVFTQWELRSTGYWVEVIGHWVQVPQESIIRGNPVGVAVVWVTYLDGIPVVRCFAPGGEG